VIAGFGDFRLHAIVDLRHCWSYDQQYDIAMIFVGGNTNKGGKYIGKKVFMNRLFAYALILMAIVSCKSTPPSDLSSQLKKDASSRLLKIDSSAIIDSFKVMQVDTIGQRFGKIMDDTIYIRQLNSVREDLAHAKTRSRKDSIAYFQGEIDYMTGQIDSLTASIKTADTTYKWGIMAGCYYRVRKNTRQAHDSIYYFIQKSGEIVNSEMLDSFIVRSYRKLK
jgi:hypothetical protein